MAGGGAAGEDGYKTWASQKHQSPCWELIPLGSAGIINCMPLSCVSSGVCFATQDSKQQLKTTFRQLSG